MHKERAILLLSACPPQPQHKPHAPLTTCTHPPKTLMLPPPCQFCCSSTLGHRYAAFILLLCRDVSAFLFPSIQHTRPHNGAPSGRHPLGSCQHRQGQANLLLLSKSSGLQKTKKNAWNARGGISLRRGTPGDARRGRPAGGGGRRGSVALDVAVDAAHKDGAAEVAERAGHDGQAQAEHERVAKVEAGLEEARHLGLHEEVVHRVQEHVPAQQPTTLSSQRPCSPCLAG